MKMQAYRWYNKLRFPSSFRFINDFEGTTENQNNDMLPKYIPDGL